MKPTWQYTNLFASAPGEKSRVLYMVCELYTSACRHNYANHADK